MSFSYFFRRRLFRPPSFLYFFVVRGDLFERTLFFVTDFSSPKEIEPRFFSSLPPCCFEPNFPFLDYDPFLEAEVCLAMTAFPPLFLLVTFLRSGSYASSHRHPSLIILPTLLSSCSCVGRASTLSCQVHSSSFCPPPSNLSVCGPLFFFQP